MFSLTKHGGPNPSHVNQEAFLDHLSPLKAWVFPPKGGKYHSTTMYVHTNMIAVL